MSTIGRFAIAGMALGLLAGCTGMQLGQAQKTPASGSAFNNKLHSEYVTLAKSEYDQGDYRDSDNFAQRAISSAKGEPTEPEAITARRLPASEAGDLQDARTRLVTSLSDGAREKMPDDAAHAQAMFDCWMEQQEENFQPADISRCRDGFYATMAKIDDGMKPIPAATAAAPPDPVVKRYVVYFPFDSTALTPQSAEVVRQAIDDSKSLGGARVQLVGHTDTMGPQEYNMKLSAKRVESVVEVMDGSGLSSSTMDLTAFGEADLSVATPDNVANQENRRVEIVITK